MEYELVTPKSYPVNLIDKDWSKRALYYRSPAKNFPDKIHDFQVRTDDVWIVTNVKCGTTWMQELVWLLMNNCDYEAALSEHLEIRSPFLEYDFIITQNADKSLNRVNELPSPRIIKSHQSLGLLPAQLWEGKAKLIYVFRDPKDAWVSSYYHGVSLGLYPGKSLEQYIDDVMNYYNEKRDPMQHAIEFYQLRNKPWIYYTSFEMMKHNLRGVIEDLCKFLNKCVPDQQMERLLKHLSFEEMKKNPTTNHLWELSHKKRDNLGNETHNFIRKGKVGGHKEELKSEQVEKLNRIISEKCEEHRVTLDELLLLNRM